MAKPPESTAPTPAKKPAKPRAAAKPKVPSKAARPAEAAAPAAAAGRNPTDWVKVGVGVGSAALVAALLYATRSKRNDWTK